MKWKIGAFMVAGVVAICMIPALVTMVLGGGDSLEGSMQIFASKKVKERTMTLQIDNSFALQDKVTINMTDSNGDPIAPFVDENGNTMLPLRYLADVFGAEITYDANTRMSTLVLGERQVQISNDNAQMIVDGEQREMATVPANINGSLYVPLRAVSEAFEWQVHYVDRMQGHLVIVSNKEKELEEKQIEDLRQNALSKLGYSVEQIVSDSVIVRAGVDAILVNNTVVDIPHGLTTVDVEGVYYLPTDVLVQLTNNQLTSNEEGHLLQGGKVVSREALEIDGTMYHAIGAFAEAMGQNYLVLSEGVAVMTGVALKEGEPKTDRVQTLAMTLELPGENIPVADYYVALTFDDGPTGAAGTGLTSKLLDALAERNVHATFFLCGYRVKDFNSFMNRYLDEGHELGNHTMDHKNLTSISDSAMRAQLTDTNDLIASYVGEEPTMMRPTGGAYNDNVKKAMKDLGLPIIMWSLDTRDWAVRDADHVYNSIVNNVQDGDIVLMHDLYTTTVEGVIRAIDKLQAEGYAFVTVSELATIKGVTLEGGEVYNKITSVVE